MDRADFDPFSGCELYVENIRENYGQLREQFIKNVIWNLADKPCSEFLDVTVYGWSGDMLITRGKVIDVVAENIEVGPKGLRCGTDILALKVYDLWERDEAGIPWVMTQCAELRKETNGIINLAYSMVRNDGFVLVSLERS